MDVNMSSWPPSTLLTQFYRKLANFALAFSQNDFRLVRMFEHGRAKHSPVYLLLNNDTFLLNREQNNEYK